MTRNGNQVRGLDPASTSPAGAADQTTSIPAGQSGRWAWEDLNLRPHPQVKIAGRRGKLPGTYQGRRGPRLLREAVTAQRPCSDAHLHPSGVAAGHEPLIRY